MASFQRLLITRPRLKWVVATTTMQALARSRRVVAIWCPAECGTRRGSRRLSRSAHAIRSGASAFLDELEDAKSQ